MKNPVTVRESESGNLKKEKTGVRFNNTIFKQNAAITLIALVITIIVLLILAGVALYMTLGDSGIFEKANTAKEQTNIKSATELMNLKILEIKTKGYAENETVDLQYLSNNLIADTEIEYVSNTSNPTEPYPSTIDTTGKTAVYTKLNAYPYEFTINDGMEVTNIDGQAISTISSGSSGSGNTGGSTSGGTGNVAVSDYTTNLLYRTDYANMQNGQNGVTMSNSGVTINGSGNYATFDGTGYITVEADSVDSEGVLTGTGGKTIMCWYRCNPFSGGERVLAWFGDMGISGARGGGITLAVRQGEIGVYGGYGVNDCVVNPVNKYDGKWHFVVGTFYDTNKARFYFDNVAFENTEGYNTKREKLHIGGYIPDNNRYFDGDIGEIRIYSQALTDEQVSQLYKYGRQNNYPEEH